MDCLKSYINGRIVYTIFNSSDCSLCFKYNNSSIFHQLQQCAHGEQSVRKQINTIVYVKTIKCSLMIMWGQECLLINAFIS